MQKNIYSKGNVVPWLVVTIVVLIIIFFVVRNNRMKEVPETSQPDQTAGAVSETTITNPPTPTSNSSVDQDMASIDTNLSIISSDDKDINSGINDTPVPQE